MAALAALLLPPLGCRSQDKVIPQQAQQERQAQQQAYAYANAYKALMQDYRAKMIELTSRPLPARSTPVKERRAILGRHVESLSQAAAEWARRMDRLKPQPPDEFREVHDSTHAFFRTSAQGGRRWSAALGAGKWKEARQVRAQTEAAEKQALTRMAEAFERIGGTAPGLRQLVQEMAPERK